PRHLPQGMIAGQWFLLEHIQHRPAQLTGGQRCLQILDHQVLATGQLRGAVLDVFEQEPLPSDHSLWQMPGVVVTPHMASAASHPCIVRQVAENTRRLLAGEVLNHRVDPSLGY
ncbi:MAG: hypothetical protein EOP02_08740, partial [Proteobacteria bacterium]